MRIVSIPLAVLIGTLLATPAIAGFAAAGSALVCSYRVALSGDTIAATYCIGDPVPEGVTIARTSGENVTTIWSSNPQPQDQMGLALAALSPTVRGNDRSRPRFAFGAGGLGEVYLVDGDGHIVRTLRSPNRVETQNGFDASQFGAGLAAANGRLFVVATGEQPPALYVMNTWSGRIIRHMALPVVAQNPAVAVHGRRVAIGGDIGVVLVLDWPTGTVLQTLHSPGSGGQYGWAVAIGHDILVGAPGDDPDGGHRGSVYVYDRQTGALVNRLRDPNALPFWDHFGGAVAYSGNRIVVGADNDPTGRARADGRVYVFDSAKPAATVQTISSDVNDGYFGGSLAVSGSQLAVGAWGYDTEGFVAVYDWTPDSP